MMTKTIKNVLTGSKVSIKVDGKEVAIAEGVTYAIPTFKTPIYGTYKGPLLNPLEEEVEYFLDILKRTGNAEAGHLLEERGLGFPGLRAKGILSVTSSPIDEDQLKRFRKEWDNVIKNR